MIESGLVEGSVLFLDDIQIEYFPVSVDEKMASTRDF